MIAHQSNPIVGVQIGQALECRTDVHKHAAEAVREDLGTPLLQTVLGRGAIGWVSHQHLQKKIYNRFVLYALT